MSRAKARTQVSAATTFTTQGKRNSQEDFVLCDQQKAVFVVADGFGGPIPGAQAAKSSCESIRNFLFKQAGDLDATMPFVLRQYFSLAGNVLFNSLIYANRALMQLNKGKNINEKGGASALAAFLDGDLLAIANVGTCSAWILRQGLMVELVMPRSFGRLLDPFASSRDEKNTEENQVPLIALGMTEDLEPEIFEYRVKPQDMLVLSTDGISPGVVQEIAKLQEKKWSSDQLIQESAQCLNQYSYQDNATALIVVI